VLERAGSGRLDDELREHISACAHCRDLFEVAAAILVDRATAIGEARLPGSGLVWWRANVRARQEAARAAVRVASFVQVILLVTAIIVALALVGSNLRSVDFRAVFMSIAAGINRLAVPMVALAAWLILAPVALYFAVTEE
jgi:predicted anti-sigma-YlaC factor YlaD